MRDCRSTFVFSPRYLDYDFGPEHPLQPRRLAALHDLISALHLLDSPSVTIVEPAPATDAELELAHTTGYIDAVRALSESDHGIDANRYGLGPEGDSTGDTPFFPHLHEVAATIAGGTLTAIRRVMSGAARHAFNPGGGLHHAHRARASGFCVYNDLVVAIAAAVIEHGARVLYIDFDVHHGDGVQAAFYDDPRVLTVSFHETGRYLFPGTGAVLELGTGAGLGTSINVPLAAFTETESWLEAVQSLLPPLADRFQPDLIVSQHGCDGHVWDGQSHLLLTMEAYRAAAHLVHDLAHRHCSGRWVAAGGGGYDPVRVVPRAWAALWSEMVRGRAPIRLPAAWRRRWQPLADGPMPDRFTDPPEIIPPIEREAAIEVENRATVARVRELALSARLRRAYRPAGGWTPAAVAQFPAGRSERMTVDGRPIVVRERAPHTLLRRLRAADDLHAFARTAERETRLLRNIAAQPDANLTIAYTPAGEIVAEITLAPAEGRWDDMDCIYELAFEVAQSWRGSGLADRLLEFVLTPPYVENLIVIALGLSWHWDLQNLNLSPRSYRDLLIRTLEPTGFRVMLTDDPEIIAADANVFLARIGASVPADTADEFERRLTRRRDWYGF